MEVIIVGSGGNCSRCPLSPILFNIYIDGVKNIFDETCDPISLQGNQINHSLYADDLVLFSSSRDGLQNCLFRLQTFSKVRNSAINSAKTKTMIFDTTNVNKTNVYC